ncbi:MAG: hypothetical protein L0H93_14595 [Nocardioides sp.]|nr:hypothetical protein [Nocardioides sp.]
MSALQETLRAELVAAMKRKDRSAVSAFRTTIAALENAEAVAVETHPAAGAIEGSALGAGAAETERRVLTAADEAGILRDQITEREDTAASLGSAQAETAERLRREASVLAAIPVSPSCPPPS